VDGTTVVSIHRRIFTKRGLEMTATFILDTISNAFLALIVHLNSVENMSHLHNTVTVAMCRADCQAGQEMEWMAGR
jgi:hypothetical protein